jgi:hypothetical protein
MGNYGHICRREEQIGNYGHICRREEKIGNYGYGHISRREKENTVTYDGEKKR